jgi:hypothetical protein
MFDMVDDRCDAAASGTLLHPLAFMLFFFLVGQMDFGVAEHYWHPLVPLDALCMRGLLRRKPATFFPDGYAESAEPV